MDQRYICFDMDGVIIDSEPSHFEAFRRTFLDVGIQLSHGDYQKHFAGTTDEQGLINYAQSLGRALGIPKLQEMKRAHYEELAATTVMTDPATINTIHALSFSHRLALVTSSPLAQVKPILNRFDLMSFFPVMVTAEDVMNGKPDPEGYLLAAERMKTDPTHCIVIEDAPSGVAAAKRAGMYCVALTTSHTAQELVGADRVVEQLSPELFDSGAH